MRAIDREDAKQWLLAVVVALVADEDAGVSGRAIPRLTERIFKRDHPRLIERKGFDGAEIDPSHFRRGRTDEVTHQGETGDGRSRGAGRIGEPTEKRPAAGKQVERRLNGWFGLHQWGIVRKK